MSDKRICPVCDKSFDECKCDPEKDWGLKIGSTEEAEWKKIHENSILAIGDSQRKKELNEVCRDYAKKRMDEEHIKFLEENKK